MNNLADFSDFGYQAIEIIGQNYHGGRITYLAKDLKQEKKVVIKQFQFARSNASWSIQDILDREIKILQQLDHPRIPRYINSFANHDGFCLVQEYKNAPSLAEIKTFKPQEIKVITISILEILVYLQKQIPPVIHRDIKPANILLDSNNNAYLIDFGFSRIGTEEVSGSSVVKGTPGFMPPEQLWGRLTKSSDLYSLGMTIICLLSGISSRNIRQHINNDYQVNFRPLISGVSNHFLEWLEKMVRPNPNKRYLDAETALTTLELVEIIPSPFEQKQTKIKSKQTSIEEKISNWLSLKSTIISLIVGAIVGLGWGQLQKFPIWGLFLGIVFGLGLSLTFGFPRKSKQFLSLPPWQNFIGAVAIAISLGIMSNPVIILRSSEYFSFTFWHHQHPKVARGSGFILYTDRPNPIVDLRYAKFINLFRQEVAEYLFDPGKVSCSVDIHLLKLDKNYFAVANRFGIQTPYGFLMHPPLHDPVIVVRANSGLGTLTHQIIYHYLDCSYPEGLPLWATQGVATFVEKFLAIEENKQLNFSWGYRSNWRDPYLRKVLDSINLNSTLQAGKQQSAIRSFFLFLHQKQLLFPLLDRLHGERSNGISRIEQLFDRPIYSVEKLWKEWVLSDALQIPMVELSFMAWGEEARRVRSFLNSDWRWDEKRQIWLRSSLDEDNSLIPGKETILKAQDLLFE